jgi:hypothetical protein
VTVQKAMFPGDVDIMLSVSKFELARTIKNTFCSYAAYFTQLPIRVRHSALTSYSIRDRQHILTPSRAR